MGVYGNDGGPEHTVLMDKGKSAAPEDLQLHQESKIMKCLKHLKGRSLPIIIGLCLLMALVGIYLHITHSECKKEPTSPGKDDKTEFSTDSCEDYWLWYRGKCYYFSTERDTWRNSEKFCHSHESSLAIIDDKEELDFLYRFKGLDNHWIGIKRTDDNTGWIWINGTSYSESLFTIRMSENSAAEEHVYLHDGEVKSVTGAKEFKWICTKPSPQKWISNFGKRSPLRS